MTNTTSSDTLGKCQHCGVAQFNNPDADPALDSMAHLCWKCVRPHGVAALTAIAAKARA